MAEQDDEAFREAMIAVIPHLRAFARTFVSERTDADDLVQDALTKAWAARDGFTPGTNLRAWSFMILRNSFLSGKRRAWRSTPLDQETAEQTLVANSDPSAALELDDVRRALRKLPLPQREALILIGAGGLAYEEAAQIAGVAIGTIKSRVNRARAALAAILDKERIARDATAASDAMSEILADLEDLRGGRPLKP